MKNINKKVNDVNTHVILPILPADSQSIKPKILVFILARRGCIAYANEMISLLQNVEIKIYASRYSEEILPNNSHLIPTFRNAFEFVWRTIWTLPNFLWKIRADFRQGYQIFYFPFLHHWNPAILLLAKWLGAKTVVTVHDALAHPGEPELAENWLQNRTIHLANQLVVLSAFVKNQLPNRFHSKTKIIPHPLLFAEIIAPNRMLSTSPKLLFLGRIAYYKGVDLLVEALQDFSSETIQQLTIAGMPMQETPIPATTFPIQKIERWLSDAEILQLLTEHDILILPYREASQSGVITLGISSAIPMVITKVGGLQEQLAEDEAIWVEPSVESIQKGLLKLIENADLYQIIHKKLLQKKVQSSPNNIQAQLNTLFHSLATN